MATTDARHELALFVLSLAGQMFQRCQAGEPVAHLVTYFDQVAFDLFTGTREALQA